MYNKLVHKVFSGVIEQAENKEEKEVVIYGLEAIVSNFVMLLAFLFIGFLSHNFFATIIYLLCFFFVRVLVGGYHANTHLTCLLSSVFMYSFVVVINPFVTIEYNNILIFVTVLSYFVILGVAPVLNGKRSFADEEIHSTRRKVKIVLAIEFILAIVLYQINFELYKFAAYAIIMEGVLGAMGKIKYRKFNKTAVLKKMMKVSLGVALFSGWIPCALCFYEPEMPKALKEKLEK